jgi:hypothetical protein
MFLVTQRQDLLLDFTNDRAELKTKPVADRLDAIAKWRSSEPPNQLPDRMIRTADPHSSSASCQRSNSR